MAPKRAIPNLYSSRYYRGKNLKTRQEKPHLLRGRFLIRPPAQDDQF